mgnify:CR=1 FL=1
MNLNLSSNHINNLDSNIIKFYSIENSDKIIDALYHGFKIVSSNDYAINYSNSTQKIKEILKENQNREQNKLLKHQEEIQELKLQIQQLKANEIDYLKKETEKKILFQNSIEEQYRSKISNLEDKCDSIRNQERNYYLEKENKLNSENETLREKLEIRTNIMSNSSKKGKEGEEDIFKVLSILFPNAEIIDTHKDTGNGDFRIIIKGFQILYEHKNFGTNVPKRDLDKFRRDVNHNDCHCGIICSQNTGIASKNDLDIEIIKDKPIIFLHHTNQNTDKIRIACLILINILENKLDITHGKLHDIKNLLEDIKNLNSIIKKNEKNIKNLKENNETLNTSTKSIKITLQNLIKV